MAAVNPQASFSPLTLFECTITNATMLVDSMPLQELVLAMRYVLQLHGHMMDVLEPTAVRVSELAEQHSSCPPPFKVTKTQAGTSKIETKMEYPGVQVKQETFDDEDVHIIEDNSFNDYDNSSMASGVDSYGFERPAKMPRCEMSSPSASGNSELTAEWKNLLRNAYKQLKSETNSNVFDFSCSYSTNVNTQAANRVIDKACEMSDTGFKRTEQWTKKMMCLQSHQYLRVWFTRNLKPAHKLTNVNKFAKTFDMIYKLNRRQKSFEQLKESMGEQEKSKYEAVLNRDYTSSDDEVGADLDGDTRVKELTWESAELRELKSRLDNHFFANLADAKQKSEMNKLKRVGLKSSRPPPSDGQFWAKNRP